MAAVGNTIPIQTVNDNSFKDVVDEKSSKRDMFPPKSGSPNRSLDFMAREKGHIFKEKSLGKALLFSLTISVNFPLGKLFFKLNP